MLRIVTLLCIIYAVFMMHHQIIYADEFKMIATPILPKSQIDNKKDYFDIQLLPNQSETLEVELRNITDEELEIDISFNVATTNSNVIVEYGNSSVGKDKSLIYDLEKYVEYPKSIELKAKSVKNIKFIVKMPDKKFDGVLAGGITFKEVSQRSHDVPRSSGLSIKNEYSYVIGLLARQNMKKVEPNLELKEVEENYINSKNMVVSKLKNDRRTYINQVSIESIITKKDSNQVLYRNEKNNLQIAPNTTFLFPTYLEGVELKSGDYKIELIIYSDQNDKGKFVKETDNGNVKYNYRWNFSKDFTVNREIVNEVVDKDFNEIEIINQKRSGLKLVILVNLVILLILFFLWIFYYKNRKRKKVGRETKNRKRKK